MSIAHIYLFLLILFGTGTQGLLGQKTVSPSGGDASNGGASISYTVGQIDYFVDSGLTGSSSQGVQQPWEISVVTEIDQELNDLDCRVYPNPTSDRLILETEALGVEPVSYQLVGVEGNLLSSGLVENTRFVIPVENLPTGSYFLKVTQGHTPIKTFKIIKTH